MPDTEVNQREKIIELLRKLIAKERGAREISSFAEAEAYALKISELYLRYRIREDEVAVNEDDTIEAQMVYPWEHGYQFLKKRIPWQEALGNTIARNNLCRFLIVKGSNLAYFVGKEADRAVAIFLYGYLVKEIEKAASTGYDKAFYDARQNGTVERVRGWRQSFITGTLAALADRFAAQRAVVEAEVGAKKFAVVRKADLEVEDYLKQQNVGTVDSDPYESVENHEALRAGLTFGEKLSLAPHLTKGMKRRPAYTGPPLGLPSMK